ncbi:hypothetical protein [Sphingobium chungbukense]|uniref:hypothetical protein n=1 Tax=Sphingobium chungbukense TaxID=56193 RepID=UPI0018DCABF0|nr:hypothetical protein [Sphingobium chungbukense]
MQCPRLSLCHPFGPPDPAYRRFDDLGSAGIVMAKSAVGFRDGRKPTLDRGDGVGFG